MVDTNNVRITTPGGEVKYIDSINSGGTELNSDTSDESTTTSTVSGNTSNTSSLIKIISVGNGNAVLKGLIDNSTYAIRSIIAGENINIITNDNTLTISSVNDETIQLKSLGNGENILNQISDNSYGIKSIIAGNNISLISDGNSITISSTNSNSDSIDLLSELKDVDITTTPPVNGDVLAYNGTEWVNLTPDWSGQTAKFPIGSMMWIPITGSMGNLVTDSDTLYMNSITSMPTSWSLINIDNSMISINTGLPSNTAFPVMMQSSVGSILQADTAAKMVTATSYSPNQAMMDFDNNTGILNLYRINSQTIFCSGDETSITLYIGFYIMKDQQTIWS